MILIDTHTHLYAEEFDGDRAKVVQTAVDSGIQKLFLPNVDRNSIPRMLALSEAYPSHCFPMIGLHPCSVNADYEQELTTMAELLLQTKFYAVGEIGMDLYWDKTFIQQQQKAFEQQILLAKKYKLPIVIHTRNAFDEAFEIVNSLNDNSLKGIFHCFSGTRQDADKVIALGGFKLGIGGVLTFKNSGLDKVIEQVALEYLVLETDAPYLAPVPYRGKRNESAYLTRIAEKLAIIKNCSLEEVAKITTANAAAIFENAFIEKV